MAYVDGFVVAVPAANLLTFLMTVLRGAGDSRTPFYFMLLAVVLDIALNPLLIAGIGPFPRLGIAGSATSTLVGQTISVVALLALLYARKHPLRLAGSDLALLKPDPALLQDLKDAQAKMAKLARSAGAELLGVTVLMALHQLLALF